MTLIVQQLTTASPSSGVTLTVGDIIGRVSQDVRFQLSTSGTSQEILIDYTNRVHLELLRTSRWSFLLSPVMSFTTLLGKSDYLIGTDVLPIGAVDTGLAIPDLKTIKRGSMFDRTNFKSLFPTTEAPLIQSLTQAGSPRLWRNDVATPGLLNIYPPANGVYTIEFRYFRAPVLLTQITDLIQLPDRYQDVLIAGINELAFVFLKRADEALYWGSSYRQGKISIIRDMNLFPRGSEFISPDPVSQARSSTGDTFFDLLYNN